MTAAQQKSSPRFWQANRINDFAVIPVDGWLSIPQRLLGRRFNTVMSAASNDTVLTEALLRIIGLIDPPSRLLRPSMLMRVIKGNRRSTFTPNAATS